MFYIYKAIADDPRLKEYRKVIACNRKNHAEVQSFLEFHGFTDFELVEVHSHEYCRAIATAKYLFNNSITCCIPMNSRLNTCGKTTCSMSCFRGNTH